MRNQLKRIFSSGTGTPLWTKNYTILTLGSAISYMGNATMSFAMGLCILDLFDSVLVYSLYLFCYSAAKIAAPLFAGALLDRSSRTKAIYLLDFTSAAIYFFYWLFYQTAWFSVGFFFVGAVMIGVIDSVYKVAFGSLYPMAAAKENLSRAYSIYSVMETLACVMVPVAAVLYKFIGIRSIFLIGAVLFFTAAVTETFIRIRETYAETQEKLTLRRYFDDFRDGFAFLKTEKALIITIFVFSVGMLVVGVQGTIWLPYFKESYENGYFWYLLVTGANMSGRFIGGSVLYFVRIPRQKKYLFTCIFLLVSGVFHALSLSIPLLAACILQYIAGITDVAAYNLNTASVFGYLRDERKARYLGIFSMCANLGLLAGQLSSGILSEVMSLPLINMISGVLLAAAAAVGFGIAGRSAIAALYLQEEQPPEQTVQPELDRTHTERSEA